MERNPNDSFENQDVGQGDITRQDLREGAHGFDNVSGTLGNESLGSSTSPGRVQGALQQGKEKAQQGLSQVRERASQVPGQVREKAGALKTTLADKLEAGADRLRQRSSGTTGQDALSAGDGSTALQSDETVSRVSGAVASGMQSTADWLRTADVNSMRTGIEQQVRTNPGRTLLVALGIGYVLGRVFRGGQGGSGGYGSR